MRLLILATTLTTFCFADSLPPLPFGDIPDLGYADGFLPAICTDAQGNYTPDTCGVNGFDHVYQPGAESPDGHWVGVALFDMDVDAQLILWHDGAYTFSSSGFIYGSPLVVYSIDNNGVATGLAVDCSSTNGFGTGDSYFISDVGCVDSLTTNLSNISNLSNLSTVTTTTTNIGATPVPEPGSASALFLLLVGAWLLLRKRARR